MKIAIYHSLNFTDSESPIFKKIKNLEKIEDLDKGSSTTLKALYKKGWTLKQAIHIEDFIENTVALCPNCHRRMHILDLNRDVSKLKAVATALAYILKKES